MALLKNALEYQADFLRCLGDKTRLRILKALMEREKTVSQLVQELQSSQANISGHLKTLKNTGILKSRQQGKYVYYSLNDKDIQELLIYLEHRILSLRRKAFEGI